MEGPESPTRRLGSIGHIDHVLQGHQFQTGRRLGKSVVAAAILENIREMERERVRELDLSIVEARLAASEVRGWSDEEKDIARQLDPECWVSYSGKNREFKRAMDRRRLDSLNKAARELAKEQL